MYLYVWTKVNKVDCLWIKHGVPQNTIYHLTVHRGHHTRKYNVSFENFLSDDQTP